MDVSIIYGLPELLVALLNEQQIQIDMDVIALYTCVHNIIHEKLAIHNYKLFLCSTQHLVLTRDV
jgi:hypothetical protein